MAGNIRKLLMELMLRKFCFQNIMWWLEISESSRSNYYRNSKKSWKQTAGWKYQKILLQLQKNHNVMAKPHPVTDWHGSPRVTRCFTGFSFPPPPKTSVTDGRSEFIYRIFIHMTSMIDDIWWCVCPKYHLKTWLG